MSRASGRTAVVATVQPTVGGIATIAVGAIIHTRDGASRQSSQEQGTNEPVETKHGEHSRTGTERKRR